MQTSAGKILASVFWDVRSILFTDYLEKELSIANFIWHYWCGRKKLPKMVTNEEEKSTLSPRQCPTHKSIATMAKLHELHFKLLLHPPYSPDLTPSNYWLFADLKKMLQGKRFGSNEEVISETEAYFVAKDKSFYKEGIELLEKRWNLCITLEGDCS